LLGGLLISYNKNRPENKNREVKNEINNNSDFPGIDIITLVSALVVAFILLRRLK